MKSMCYRTVYLVFLQLFDGKRRSRSDRSGTNIEHDLLNNGKLISSMRKGLFD